MGDAPSGSLKIGINAGTSWATIGSTGNVVDFFGTEGQWVMVAKVATVPEPSTLAIFAFGLAGLGFVTRRRRTGVGKTLHAS